MDIWNTIILHPMVNILIWIYSIIAHNFGLAIVIFTIIIRLITYPLTASQLKATKKMQELNSSKRYQEIQKKYKDDREKLAQEQMKLYKELGINPFSSCLPTLIQFPIMIGLYQSISLAMAAAPIQMLNLSRSIYAFIPAATLIPIKSQFLWWNLGLPETATPIFNLIIPGLGIGLPILTILVVVTTYLQSKLMTPPSTNPNDQSAAMSRTMTWTMPVFMGWISFTLSSGLALYFIISNVLGIIQYAIMGNVHWSNLLPKKKVVDIKASK